MWVKKGVVEEDWVVARDCTFCSGPAIRRRPLASHFSLHYTMPSHIAMNTNQVNFVAALAEIISVKEVQGQNYYYVHYVDCKYIFIMFNFIDIY